MNTTQTPPLRKRPGVITALAVLLALEGISEVSFGGIWMIITRKMQFPSQPLRVAVIDYLIQQFPSLLAQIVLSILAGILFLILAWGLSMLKPWSYWITLFVVFPFWMIYDLSKTLILFFHNLPTTVFENPNISSNVVPFIIELMIFLSIFRKSIRNAFYRSQVKY
jgi:hypothetical protein